MPYTTLRCHQCEETEAFAPQQPTPAEWAHLILGGYRDESLALMNDGENFSAGWEFGIEGGDTNFPISGNEVAPKRAWLMGFLAGQCADYIGAVTPVCMNADHE